MTPRQQAFVAEYVIHPNGTQAAIRAGYSPRTAVVQGSRLLTNVNVRDAIQERRGALAEKFHVTQERLVEEYKLAAFAQVADPVTWTEKHKALDSLARILGFDKPEPRGSEAPPIQIHTIIYVSPGSRAEEPPTVVEGEVKGVQ